MFTEAQNFHRFAWTVSQTDGYATEIESFLEAVLVTAKSRIRRVPKGAIFFRAQRGYELWTDDEDEITVADAFGPVRMKPRRDNADPGRVNRKDVPCLYVATDRNPAMAEVRPWRGAYVTLAQFKLSKDCVLIDCSVDRRTTLDMMFSDIEITPELREQGVWGDIGAAFSKPLTRDDSLDQYLATQVLADRFKTAGYDGVAYKSALGEGKNIALFDLDAADPINGTLYEAESVSYEFQQKNNTYFIPKHYPDLASSMGLETSEAEAEVPHSAHVDRYLPMESEGGDEPVE